MDNIYGTIIALAFAAVLGFIPANIAKRKGYSFGLWWFYGWMLFIVAIIHVSLIRDKNAAQTAYTSSLPYSSQSSNSLADELKKYKELLDQGIITEEEFTEKKKQILNMM